MGSTNLFKACRDCKKSLPLDSFWRAPQNADGYQSRCVGCAGEQLRLWREKKKQTAEGAEAFAIASKRGNLKAKFGMTIADYDSLFASQGGLCAICEMPEKDTRNGRIKKLAVDHDHATRKVRGLLCSNCNTALGKFKDSKELLLKAIVYLNSTGGY